MMNIHICRRHASVRSPVLGAGIIPYKTGHSADDPRFSAGHNPGNNRITSLIGPRKPLDSAPRRSSTSQEQAPADDVANPSSRPADHL